MTVWYRVSDLDVARTFYRDTLGFTETYVDGDGQWARLERGGMEIAVAEGDLVDVADVKAEAERLRAAGVEVGIVLELHGQMRILDVYDPDGNRIQLAQELADDAPGG